MTAAPTNDSRAARLRQRAPAAVLALAFVAFAVEATRRGLRFPIPWSDEGSFLWPALAFRDRFDLFAPEVNPLRDALWMPPGFMVLHGLVFSVIEFSLQRARAVSLVLSCGAVAAVIGMAWPLRARLAHVVAATAVLTVPIVMIVGNTARMESLVLALVTAGFLLLGRGRASGLALLAVAPLVHPNGLFAFAGGTVYTAILLVRLRRHRALGSDEPRSPPLVFGWVDSLLLVSAVAAWGAYAAYVAPRWEWFKVDMEAQLRFKMMISYGEDSAGTRLTEPAIIFGLASFVIGAVLAARHRVPVLGLVILAASLFVQTAVAAGWLYEVYPVFALLVSTIVLVESLQAALAARGEPRAPAIALAVAVVSSIGIVVVGRGAFLTRSLERAVVDRETQTPEYLTAEDRAVVAARLQQLAAERGRITVQFLPAGEGLVFESLRGPSLGMVEQTFYVNTFDVLVVHESVWCSRFMHDIQILRYLTLAAPPIPPPELLRERDQSERWVIYPLTPRAHAPPR